jgi:hypothetical protein
MSNTPDSDYKTIFAHPEMVVDIITGFAPGPWLDDIDFATLEPFKSIFVSTADDPEQRHSDLIWRVRHKNCVRLDSPAFFRCRDQHRWASQAQHQPGTACASPFVPPCTKAGVV